MDDNTNISLTVAAWADIVLERWIRKIESLHINDSYQLVNSFIQQVISDSGGNPERIEFAFKYYGKFVDMGVGKGITLADVGMRETKRRPKKWYSPVFYAEVRKLALLLAEKYAHKAAIAICENIDDNAQRWNNQKLM